MQANAFEVHEKYEIYDKYEIYETWLWFELGICLPPLYLIFRQNLKSHDRPNMWYIFGKPWVQESLWQCSEVSDMQIHKYKYKYKYASTITSVHN